MVALNFRPDFVPAINCGRKSRTIRRVRKTGNPKPGDVLQLYTGMRTAGCKHIRNATCIRVRPVRIAHEGIELDGAKLLDNHDFARADGFENHSDMLGFFEKHYGLPFDGQLIEWTLP